MIPSSASLEAHEEAMRLEEEQFRQQKSIEQWLENRLSQGTREHLTPGSCRSPEAVGDDSGVRSAPAIHFNGGAASPLLANVTAAQAPAVGFREEGR